MLPALLLSALLAATPALANKVFGTSLSLRSL